MPAHRKPDPQKIIAALQQQWGQVVIRRGAQPLQPAVISTSFPELDAALGIAGIPRAHLTEIYGAPTSGMGTLALKVVAAAQQQGGAAVYIDSDRTFDPDYAARCGVCLDRLVIVRPYTLAQAWQMLPDFFTTDGPGVLIWHTALARLQEPAVARQLSSTAHRLPVPLRHSACAFICLSSLAAPDLLSPSPLTPLAALRLQLQQERWLYRQGDIRGYTAQVRILSSQFGPAGRQVRIAITFNGTVAGSGLPGDPPP